MKKCLYCNEVICLETDDYSKVGKKYVCNFCYDDYCDEVDNHFDKDEYLDSLNGEDDD